MSLVIPSENEMDEKCVKCNTKILNRQYIHCFICNKYYHLDCANVSTQRFYLMEPSKKLSWKCYSCRRHASTPTIKYSLNDDASQQIQNNDTNRNQYRINIPTSNSFESLTEEESENSPNFRNQLNRSCPDLGYTNYDRVEELEQKINNLEEKLQSADNEIDNLLMENNVLRKTILEQKKKIDQLSIICNSSRKNVTIRRKKKAYLQGTNWISHKVLWHSMTVLITHRKI